MEREEAQPLNIHRFAFDEVLGLRTPNRDADGGNSLRRGTRNEPPDARIGLRA